MGKKISQRPWGKFCEVFGVTPRNRVLEFFLEMRELDFSIGDLAKEIQLPRATTYLVMGDLLQERCVVPSRKVSGGQLYKLNLALEKVRLLIQSFNLVLQGIVQEHQAMEIRMRKRIPQEG